MSCNHTCLSAATKHHCKLTCWYPCKLTCWYQTPLEFNMSSIHTQILGYRQINNRIYIYIVFIWPPQWAFLRIQPLPSLLHFANWCLIMCFLYYCRCCCVVYLSRTRIYVVSYLISPIAQRLIGYVKACKLHLYLFSQMAVGTDNWYGYLMTVFCLSHCLSYLFFHPVVNERSICEKLGQVIHY